MDENNLIFLSSFPKEKKGRESETDSRTAYRTGSSTATKPFPELLQNRFRNFYRTDSVTSPKLVPKLLQNRFWNCSRISSGTATEPLLELLQNQL